MTSTVRRYAAGVVALGVMTGSIVSAPVASAGPVDDSVTTTHTEGPATFVFPQGSAVIGPAVIDIDTVVADVEGLRVVLDTIGILAQITAPFGVRG